MSPTQAELLPSKSSSNISSISASSHSVTKSGKFPVDKTKRLKSEFSNLKTWITSQDKKGQLDSLCKELGMTEKQIRNWFNNEKNGDFKVNKGDEVSVIPSPVNEKLIEVIAVDEDGTDDRSSSLVNVKKPVDKRKILEMEKGLNY